MKKFWIFLAAVCLAAVATACGGSSSTQQAATTASAGTTSAASTPTTEAGSPTAAAAAATITIASMSFGDPITVPAGAVVSVKNNDSVEHSVTSETKGVFDVDVEGNSQKTFTAPAQPGAYPIVCKYHPSMKGTLTVQ
jgi:plastocyanin